LNNMLKSVKSTWRMGWILSVYGWETVRNRRIKISPPDNNQWALWQCLLKKNFLFCLFGIIFANLLHII
jgi:hypothetical protein